jgi:hypothetical protein
MAYAFVMTEGATHDAKAAKLTRSLAAFMQTDLG